MSCRSHIFSFFPGLHFYNFYHSYFPLRLAPLSQERQRETLLPAVGLMSTTINWSKGGGLFFLRTRMRYTTIEWRLIFSCFPLSFFIQLVYIQRRGWLAVFSLSISALAPLDTRTYCTLVWELRQIDPCSYTYPVRQRQTDGGVYYTPTHTRSYFSPRKEEISSSLLRLSREYFGLLFLTSTFNPDNRWT